MCAVRDLAFAVVRQGDLPDDEQAQTVPLLAIVAIAHHLVCLLYTSESLF